MTKQASAAEIFLRALGRSGVRYLFGNTGTDAAPIVEAYAKCSIENVEQIPAPLLAAHETTAVSMAHGYAMVSRQLPAVFVHVSVGTANAVCSIMNAARENVPILLTAGRSPLYEDSRIGSRDAYIHWGQEMFDQASMLRELVKWDYELRGAAQTELVVQRAVSIAMSEPRGPVYLSLPREALADQISDIRDHEGVTTLAAALPPEANSQGIAIAAELLAHAEKPVILVANAGRNPDTVAQIATFAERFQVPVVAHCPRYMSFPSTHPLHLGFDPGDVIPEADVILVLECDVPWIAKLVRLRADCKVIHAGYDPQFENIPIRGFQSDLVLPGDVGALLERLTPVLEQQQKADLSKRQEWAEEKRARKAEVRARQLNAASAANPIHPAWVSHCIEQVKGDGIVVNEYPLLLDHCRFSDPGTYFGSSSAAGLGWGMGAALGAKLAEPEKLVIATLGDGSYIFANPVAAHYAAHQHQLPVLFVVFNNSMWGAVRRATMKVYPDGAASAANKNVLMDLDGLPAFEQICIAAGGYGERVELASELPAALKRALKVVREEKRQALLNVICKSI
ncbi:MAG: thiamine pyrophosphate-requiring protein [Xanthobacteraceae bacterium]